MRIEKIKLFNFRIYRGESEISFEEHKSKNIALIAGKNGFGKTTFLTSLIWAFYGKLMGQVEEKYKTDIRTAGGYDYYRKSLVNKLELNKTIKNKSQNVFTKVEIHLADVMIPSVPCKKVIIRRVYDVNTNKETLSILIDGQENELTKDVGYDVFINDFILPREIAKFFFFDAEKIVTLAEAKSAEELRSLSKAYSEVLGIKKYEDLKTSLTALLTKLRRNGVTETQKEKLDELVAKNEEYSGLIALNEEQQKTIETQQEQIKLRIDQIQEKLIREGNEITLDEVNALIAQRKELEVLHNEAKAELKKVMEIIPLVMAGNKLKSFITQLEAEEAQLQSSGNQKVISEQVTAYNETLLKKMKNLKLSVSQLKEIEAHMDTQIEAINAHSDEDKKLILDYSLDDIRKVKATYQYVIGSFKEQMNAIVRKEKDVHFSLNAVQKKIRQAERQKSNPYSTQLITERQELNDQSEQLTSKKERLISDLAVLKTNQTSHLKVLSEYEKNFTMAATDRKKYAVTEGLIEKMTVLTKRIKDEKKYALQKAIHTGLKQLMHKNNFIDRVEVRIEHDIMDIDLFDQQGQPVDKTSLSKGEQQLYATALLKALVDESGIDFPVFIDSPLQKFDPEHSQNIIKEFYPSVSAQVVLFPLLDKELSEQEYELLKPNLNGVYLIENKTEGSSVSQAKINTLFKTFRKQNDLAHQNQQSQ